MTRRRICSAALSRLRPVYNPNAIKTCSPPAPWFPSAYGTPTGITCSSLSVIIGTRCYSWLINECRTHFANDAPFKSRSVICRGATDVCTSSALLPPSRSPLREINSVRWGQIFIWLIRWTGKAFWKLNLLWEWRAADYAEMQIAKNPRQICLSKRSQSMDRELVRDRIGRYMERVMVSWPLPFLFRFLSRPSRRLRDLLQIDCTDRLLLVPFIKVKTGGNHWQTRSESKRPAHSTQLANCFPRK